jgi:SAM-dependent methyltransferase
MHEHVSHGALNEIVGMTLPASGPVVIRGHEFEMRDGVLRSKAETSAAQTQTSEVFGFKWHQRDTFESESARAVMRSWLCDRYGSPEEMSWIRKGDILVDVGCGAGRSSVELFGALLKQARFIGTDISTAIDVAADSFRKAGLAGEFVQCDLNSLPFSDESCDIVFSEGVLHHTDSTEGAFKSVARLVKPGGRFMFYVYRKKGPVREFTDDHIRAKLRDLSPEDAWRAIEPLTKLGIALGELGATINVPDDVDILGIKSGEYDIQRFFYWYVAKAFYRPDLSFQEMAHINFDWYAPLNAHRQSEAEVRRWCEDAGFDIEREVIEDAGITVVARRRNT